MQGMKKTMVHAIFFDKNFFPTVEAAKTWAQANNFKNDEHQEDDWMWVFEQVKQAEFVLGAYGEGQDFRVVQVAEGVHATVGETEVKMAKSNFKHSKDSFDVPMDIMKVDNAKRIVTGAVLVPMLVDSQGDFEFAEDIEKAAHGFMKEARNIGEQHSVFSGIGVPVESWLLREPMVVKAGQDWKLYPQGTWMMSVFVDKDKTWEKVRNGDLTGFSIGFRGVREAVV